MSQEILENKPHLLKKKKIILNCPLHTCSCSLDTSSGFSRAVSGTRLGSLSHPGVVPWPTAVRGRAAASSGGGGSRLTLLLPGGPRCRLRRAGGQPDLGETSSLLSACPAGVPGRVCG